MHVLLVNAGSSSLKIALLDADTQAVIAHGAADWAGKATHWKFAGPGVNGRSVMLTPGSGVVPDFTVP